MPTPFPAVATALTPPMDVGVRRIFGYLIFLIIITVVCPRILGTVRPITGLWTRFPIRRGHNLLRADIVSYHRAEIGKG